MRVAAEAARRFLVARHFLAPARSLEGGPGAVLEVFRKFGSIQFDPLAVAGRNHDLVLHARVADYDPGWCDLLYERREIFEAYNKGLSLVPSSEFAWFRGILSRNAPRVLAENAEVAERVLERIRAQGPLSALDFERERGTTTDWFGLPTNTVRAVLEAYAVTGVLGLARRDGNRRYYDLLERLLPADLLARDLPLREQLRHKLLSRYRAHGLLGGGGGDIFGGLGYAKPDDRFPGYPGRNALREELVERRDLVSVQVEGVPGKRLVVSEDAELLEAPPNPPPSVAFVPPFERPQNAVGAGTCCQSSSGTGSSAGSSRGSTGPTPACRCSTSGGRTASRRAVPRGSSTRRAPRLPALRSRKPPRLGTPPPDGETALPHSPVTRRSSREPVTRERDGRVRRARGRARLGRSARRGDDARPVRGAAPDSPRAYRQTFRGGRPDLPA